jgi:hypothetical protein
MIRTLSLLLALTLLPSLAQAAPKLNIDVDESRKTFTTSINFGGMFYDDTNIQSIYGAKGQFFPNITFGIVPWHQIILVEIDIGIAFSQFSGEQQFVSGAGASVDKVMMTVFPITVDLLIGVDIIDEQPVVPFGGFGMNYTLFRENEHGGGSEWSGDKIGYSAFFGGAFLLDIFEVSRSRTLDATTGINDAYLTVEGRYRDVKTQFRSTGMTTEGLSFGGWSVMAGLKLVY